MPTDIKTSKADKAIELIKQSIEIKEIPFKNHGVDIVNKMTHTIGENLIYLLQNYEISPLTDWETKIHGYREFLYQLLLLLAKPGVLEKLDEHEQKTAADKLESLISFFRDLPGGYTKEYLDYFAIDHFGHDLQKEDLEKTIDYYDFKKVCNDAPGSSTAWWPYTIDSGRLEQMKKFFNEK